MPAMTMKIRDISTPPRGVVREDFHHWLWCQGRMARVGFAECVATCPIATWLIDMKIMTNPQVLEDCIVNYDTWNRGRRWEHPAWSREFVERIDNLDLEYITAGRALDTLALCSSARAA